MYHHQYFPQSFQTESCKVHGANVRFPELSFSPESSDFTIVNNHGPLCCFP